MHRLDFRPLASVSPVYSHFSEDPYSDDFFTEGNFAPLFGPISNVWEDLFREGLLGPCGPIFAPLFGPVSNVWEDFLTEGLFGPCGPIFAPLFGSVSNVWEDFLKGGLFGP